MSGFSVVTGAFGYTGKHIAQRLIELGQPVVTLTGHPSRAEATDAVRVEPYRFDDPDAMARSIEGARVLYNTYWVRFDRGATTHERAVANSQALIRAAKLAGVERLVHISITNPSPDSPLPYFSGKARVEEAVQASGLSYAIVRPTLLFGGGDVLVNNIAYLLRRLPVFAIAGSGTYRVQPVHVDDIAEIAVEAAQRHDNMITDAIGPETFTFEELVRLIARNIGAAPSIVHVRPELSFVASRMLGWFLNDVLLTRDELAGLMADLLVSNQEPNGRTFFTQWLAGNAHTLGTRYASELDRHYRGGAARLTTSTA